MRSSSSHSTKSISTLLLIGVATFCFALYIYNLNTRVNKLSKHFTEDTSENDSEIESEAPLTSSSRTTKIDLSDDDDDDEREDEGKTVNFSDVRLLSGPLRANLCPTLEKAASEDGAISLVISNELWLDFAQNLICSLRKSGPKFSKVVFVAMDDTTMAWCLRRQEFLKCFRSPFYQSEDNDATPNLPSSGFYELQIIKTNFVYEALNCGFDAYFFDLDTLFVGNPDLIVPPHAAEIIGTCSGDSESGGDEFPGFSGYFRVKSTPHTVALFRDLVMEAATRSSTSQAFTRVVRNFVQQNPSAVSITCVPEHKVANPCQSESESESGSESEISNSASAAGYHGGIGVLHAGCLSGHDKKEDWLRTFMPGAWDESCDDNLEVSSLIQPGQACPGNIGFAVITGAKYYETRARAMQETWAKQFRKTMVFFVDRPIPGLKNISDLVFTYESYEFEHQDSDTGKTLYYVQKGKSNLRKVTASYTAQEDDGFLVLVAPRLPEDPYRDGSDRNMPILRAMGHLFPKMTWIITVDDDAYMFPEYLCQFWLNHLDPHRSQYMGSAMYVTSGEPDTRKAPPLTYSFVAGGAGLIMSNHLLKRIHPYIDACERNLTGVHGGDLRTWWCIFDYASDVTLDPNLWGLRNDNMDTVFRRSPELKNSDDLAMGYHYVSPDAMRKLYKIRLELKKGQRLTYKALAEKWWQD